MHTNNKHPLFGNILHKTTLLKYLACYMHVDIDYLECLYKHVGISCLYNMLYHLGHMVFLRPSGGIVYHVYINMLVYHVYINMLVYHVYINMLVYHVYIIMLVYHVYIIMLVCSMYYNKLLSLLTG